MKAWFGYLTIFGKVRRVPPRHDHTHVTLITRLTLNRPEFTSVYSRI
jgi:hypothetical protein